MSFLAPLFLLGTVAVALPVVFHLIRRSSRERVPFSSLMFLLPTPPRVTRRSKLENVFLLILRCLVIGLLATAFARPFLSKPVAPDPNANAGRKMVLLIDTSASMRRGDLWSQAMAKANAFLQKTSPADQLACYAFSRDLVPVMSFEQWSTLPASDRATVLQKQVSNLQPGWGATRLGNALINACELFESTTKDDRSEHHIVLISDLQEGSRLDGLQGYEWPHGIQVTVENLKLANRSNAGLQLASDRQDSDRSSPDPGVRVRVTNASDSRREQFQVGWRRGDEAVFVGQTVDTYIPPGQSRVLVLPRSTNTPAPDRIVLAGDDDPFDNTVYFIAPEPEHARVLYLGSETAQDAKGLLYYLQRAFQQTHRLTVELVGQQPTLPLTDKDLAGARFLIAKEALPEEQITTVRHFLEADRGVLVVVTNPSIGPTLTRLLGTTADLELEEASGAGYAMLGQIDFSHPLFAPFADPRYSDFTKIHFWKHWRSNLQKVNGVRVLAQFDDGSPALAEATIGKGRVWILCASWQPEDSQLALSSKFVPLLYAMLEQSGVVKEHQLQFTVGDAVTLASTTESVTMRKPDTSELKVAAGDKFLGTDQPGVYTVASPLKPMSFAVNLAPEESKTAPLPLDELERLGVPLQHQFASSAGQLQKRREHLQAVELENRQKLWRWLIVAALVLLMMETWLAGRLTRRAVSGIPEPSSA